MIRPIALTAILFAAANAPASAADVRVQVKGITAPSGTLIAALMDSDAAWTGQRKAVASQRTKVTATGDLELVFTDLVPGKYALRVMHDENDNGKLDTSVIGMPTEGYGFSNNPRVMRAAHFDEALFEVPEAGAAITIMLR